MVPNQTKDSLKGNQAEYILTKAVSKVRGPMIIMYYKMWLEIFEPRPQHKQCVVQQFVGIKCAIREK